MRKSSLLPYRRLIINFPYALCQFFVRRNNLCFHTVFFRLTDHVAGLLSNVFPPFIIGCYSKKRDVIFCFKPEARGIRDRVTPFSFDESEDVHPCFSEFFKKITRWNYVSCVLFYVPRNLEEKFLTHRYRFYFFIY